MVPSHRKTDLKRTHRGDYRRGLGRTPDGKEVKFALGFDRGLTQKRLVAILQLWEACSQTPQAFTESGKPAWDGARLEAARLIAKGERPVQPVPDDPTYQSIVVASRPGIETPVDANE
jgi:hypothetical protein